MTSIFSVSSYILMDTNASPELSSKKMLIETFIDSINGVDDDMIEWHDFVAEQRGKAIAELIKAENLKDEETREFVDNAFRNGEIKLRKRILTRYPPPVSHFGGGNREVKKQGVIDNLRAFLRGFSGLSN